ncbi:Cullin [Artemisia annua]|uniref:Cullin n=1 Tax=Artemisia annua TaxID=35608 RepID=A0A2U1KVL0_ARTAN|nr:Cullin [Artemisia annua]
MGKTSIQDLIDDEAYAFYQSPDNSLYMLSTTPQVDDLSRMYRLFSNIPKGLDRVLNMFKQHVITGGTKLELLFSFSRISHEREHLISLVKGNLQDLTIPPKYLIVFTLGYDQKENIDKAMKKGHKFFYVGLMTKLVQGIGDKRLKEHTVKMMNMMAVNDD